MRRSRKPLWAGSVHRGFESLPLRHLIEVRTRPHRNRGRVLFLTGSALGRAVRVLGGGKSARRGQKLRVQRRKVGFYVVGVFEQQPLVGRLVDETPQMWGCLPVV